VLTATCYKNNNPNLTLICPRYDIQDSKSKLTVESRPTERSSQERMASCLLGCTVVVAVLFDVDVEGKEAGRRLDVFNIRSTVHKRRSFLPRQHRTSVAILS
jgi:hypothetical protein